MTSTAVPRPATIAELISRHDGIVLDADGVLVMIGDQRETDAAGARVAGIDAALLEGVSRWGNSRSGIAPRFVLATIEP